MVRRSRTLTVAAMAAAMVAVPASAQAAQQDATATATASLGEANIVVGGAEATADPIAPCDADGEQTGTSLLTPVGSKTKYGAGETRCTRDEDGTANAKATGSRFSTDVLEQFGGPSISVRSYSAQCSTTENGSSGYIELGGVTGFKLPQTIEPGHEILIPGEEEGDPPMARIVLNELVAPEPPDGSLTTHAMHLTLFPEGDGPASGDLVLGTASCDPYGR